MLKKLTTIALLGWLACFGSAQATLVDRGGGMIYDDVNNVTWLQDWFMTGASVDWYMANVWADQLAYGGYGDWRLPTIDEFGVLTGQAGNLWFSPYFENVASMYWSSTENPAQPGSAWYLYVHFSNPSSFPETGLAQTVAVHNGDIAAHAVSEPGGMPLALLALGSLGLLRGTPRRRR